MTFFFFFCHGITLAVSAFFRACHGLLTNKAMPNDWKTFYSGPFATDSIPAIFFILSFIYLSRNTPVSNIWHDHLLQIALLNNLIIYWQSLIMFGHGLTWQNYGRSFCRGQSWICACPFCHSQIPPVIYTITAKNDCPTSTLIWMYIAFYIYRH